MRILVTGAAGFMGSHLCDYLIKAGHNVYGVDNMLGGDNENVPPSMFYRIGDCSNFDDMDYVCKDFSPELVYHLAACPHEGLSVFSPTLIARHTYLSSVAVFSAAINSGVKRIVFTSSMSRYGEWNGVPFLEHMEPEPVDPYGIAKLASENTLGCLCKAHDTECVIAVPHNVYGPKQNYRDPYRNVIAIMINRVLRMSPPIIYGDGTQQRCFSYIDDVTPILAKFGFDNFRRDYMKLDGEIFNIGPDDDPVTINHLAKLILHIMDSKMEPIYVPARPLEVHKAWPSSEKAKYALGYEHTVKLEDGITKMVDWMRKKGSEAFRYKLPIEINTPKVPETWTKKLM